MFKMRNHKHSFKRVSFCHRFCVSPSSKLDSTFELRERSRKYHDCIYFEALREQLLNKEKLKEKNTSRVNFSDVDSSGGSRRCDCSLAAQVEGGGGATVVSSGQFTWQQDPPTWRGWSHGNPGKLGCQIGQPLNRGV